jgi:hypothetical protein
MLHPGAGVGLETVPDQYDRFAELLVRGVGQPGVVGFGEALLLALASPIAVGAKIRRDGSPALTQTSPASDTRLVQPLVVPGLLGNVREQMPQVSVRVADPVPLPGEPEQHLGHRQTQQLAVVQQQGTAYSPLSDHAVGHENSRVPSEGCRGQ